MKYYNYIISRNTEYIDIVDQKGVIVTSYTKKFNPKEQFKESIAWNGYKWKDTLSKDMFANKRITNLSKKELLMKLLE